MKDNEKELIEYIKSIDSGIKLLIDKVDSLENKIEVIGIDKHTDNYQYWISGGGNDGNETDETYRKKHAEITD